MEHFYGGGGNNKPYFAHKIKVKRMTTEAFEWCSDYPSTGPFQRFHVEWNIYSNSDEMHKRYDLVQFESEQAALMFALRFGHL